MTKSRMHLSVVKIPPRSLLLAKIPEDWAQERVEIVVRTLHGLLEEYKCDSVLVLPQGAELEFLSDGDLARMGLRRVPREAG